MQDRLKDRANFARGKTMNILVLSDTHNYLEPVPFIMEWSKVTEGIGVFDRIIHLGDYVEDAQEIEETFGIPVEAVAGNNDFFAIGYASEKLVEYEGVRIFLTHGHKYWVHSGYGRVLKRGMDLKAKLVLFGHTHVPLIAENGSTVIMNPGSVSRSRSSKGDSFGIVRLKGGIAESKIVYVNQVYQDLAEKMK